MISPLYREFNRVVIARVGLLVLLALTLSSLAPRTAALAARPSGGRIFWVQRATGWQPIRAHAVASQPPVTVYAPTNAVSARQAAAIADTFEDQIYPTDTRLFGLPRRLGTVTILLTPLDGMTLGYFNEEDLVPVGPDAAYSNHGNVLYVRLPSTMPDADRMSDVNEVAAHEFQHLIEFRLRSMDRHLPPQEDWLNEGLSFYAQMANGFFTQRDALKVQAAAGEPTWHVTALNGATRSQMQHARVAYGRAGLFTTYLGTRFGSSFIRKLVVARNIGMQGIDGLLRGRHLSAAQVFADWGVASLVDQRGIYGYGALSGRLRVAPRATLVDLNNGPYDSEAASRLTAGSWSQRYLQITARHTGTLHLTVDANPAQLRVALVLNVRGPLADVRWLRIDPRSSTTTIDIRDFGRTYYGATLVFSDVSLDARIDHFRVRASLLDVSHNNGIP